MSYGTPEQICPHDPGVGYRRFLKLIRNRKERRRAKRQPDCVPTYRRFHGYSL